LILWIVMAIDLFHRPLDEYGPKDCWQDCDSRSAGASTNDDGVAHHGYYKYKLDAKQNPGCNAETQSKSGNELASFFLRGQYATAANECSDRCAEKDSQVTNRGESVQRFRVIPAKHRQQGDISHKREPQAADGATQTNPVRSLHPRILPRRDDAGKVKPDAIHRSDSCRD
jgi:hypothetical protein